MRFSEQRTEAPLYPTGRRKATAAAQFCTNVPPGPIRLSVIGHLTRSTKHWRNWGSPRHRPMWQHDRHSSPQGDRPELRNLSRLSKLRGPSQFLPVFYGVAFALTFVDAYL